MADPIEPPFATVGDLRARWPNMPPLDEAMVEAALSDASDMLVEQGVDTTEVKAGTLRRIVCAMARRSLVMPAADGLGLESIQEGAGPFQQTLKYSNPMGDLYLTKQERAALGLGRQRAFEVDLLAGREAEAPGWWTWLTP